MRKQSKLVGNMVLVLALLGGFSIVLTGCGGTTDYKNNPPTFITTIGERTVTEGETLTFEIAATDRDGDELTLWMENQPANSQFTTYPAGGGQADTIGGSFSFTPNYSQDEVIQTTFVVSDGKDESSVTVEITIVDLAFTQHSGLIDEDETWLAADNPHLVSSDIDISGGATLTIGDGCVVSFIEGKRIRVGYLGEGGLVATGAKFTSVLDSPTRGIWDGLAFAGQTKDESKLDDCIIEYGGGNGFGNIFVQDGAVSITNCTIKNSSTNGVYFLGEGHALSFLGNTISQNAAYPVTVPCNYLGGLQGSDLIGNDKDTVIVGGTLVSADASWDNLGVPFLFAEQFEIADGATVTLMPGLTLSFDQGAGIIVGSNSTGTLIADGTEEAILFTASVPAPTSGEWEGIYFGELASTSCLLANCIVEYAGENQDGAVFVDNAEIAINGTTVSHSKGYGVYFAGEGRFSSFENNVITENDLLPVLISANYAGDLAALNTLTGNATDRVEITADLVDRESTWDDLGIPYYISGIVSVGDGGILTLAPAGTFLFGNAGGLVIGESGVGTLIADGSSGEITLGSFDGTSNWVGIQFMANASSNSLLDSCTIDRAGLSRPDVDGGLYFEDCQTSTRHCMITNGGNVGVAFLGSAYPLSFEGNTITGSSSYPVAIDCDYIGFLPSTNDFTGNGTDAFSLGGTQITTSATWDDPGIPLIIAQLITINPGVQLTLSPGLELQFDHDNSKDGAGLIIDQNAALIADGTTDLIEFVPTPTLDPGGDPSNWEGLNFRPGALSASLLKSCRIYKGGGQKSYDPDRNRYPGCIHGDDGHITITDCTISGSKGPGIFFKEDGYADEFHGNEIFDNAGGPVRVEVPAVHLLNADNDFTGNGVDGSADMIEIGGNLDNDNDLGILTESVTWSDMGVPYHVVDSIRICGGAQLTIEAGTDFLLVKAMNLTVCVGASVVFDGTAIDPITFDAPGSNWGSITLAGESNNNSLLNYCIINEGGKSRCGMIKLINCNPTITNCTITNSRTCGICLVGTATAADYLEDNTFEDNDDGHICDD